MKLIYGVDVLEGLRRLENDSVQCVVTSPPYWSLRSYGVEGQLGLEKTPEEYVAKMVKVFREVRRVLRKDGTLWLNLGTSYAGSGKGPTGWNGIGNQSKRQGFTGNKHISVAQFKPKDLVPIPWMVALALQADGWWLRSDIIWSKPNPMPESVTDRPTKAHEYIFLLTKSANYFYDAEAIKEKTITDKERPYDILQDRLFDYDSKLKETLRPPKGAWNSKRSTFGKPAKKKQQLIDSGIATHGGNPGHPDVWRTDHNKRTVWKIPTEPFNDWTKIFRLKRVSKDETSDDKIGIVLLDSPNDGGLFDLIANVLCDGHEEKNLNHIVDICKNLSLEPKPDFFPIEKLHAYYFLGHSLDYFLLSRLFSANDHNNEIHKMGLFVSTNFSCMPSEERTSRILGILKKHGCSSQYLDKLSNNIWSDDLDASLLDRMLYRKIDNLSDSVSYEICYQKVEASQSHFATFPKKLVEPCILAGTSAEGCCEKCGSPWKRIIKKSGGTIGRSWHDHSQDDIAGQSQSKIFGDDYKVQTLDWKPTCRCNATKIPCTILDPFSGSGTTGEVAIGLGRDFIGIDLNEKYLELAKKRLGLFALGS